MKPGSVWASGERDPAGHNPSLDIRIMGYAWVACCWLFKVMTGVKVKP